MVVLVFVCVCAVAPRQCTRLSSRLVVRGLRWTTGRDSGATSGTTHIITAGRIVANFPYPKEYQYKSSTLRLALQSGFDRESTPKSSARIDTILVLVLQPYSPAVSYQRTAVS